MSAGIQRTRSKAQTVSLVLTVVNAIGVLACLAWSLHLRHIFIVGYKEFGGDIPNGARWVIGAHWSLWGLAALAFIALLVAKERLRRRWLPLLLNAITIPALVFYAFLFSSSMLTASFYIGSGTWEDDPKNWYRAFGEEQPSEVTVIHSKYWNSAHWTEEYMYFFEVRATPEWRDAFLRRRELQPVPPSEVRSFRSPDPPSDITPDWFAPDPVTDYDVWDRAGYHGSVFINKINGHIHFYGVQL